MPVYLYNGGIERKLLFTPELIQLIWFQVFFKRNDGGVE